jgi:DNA-binding MarR family transcriptional regulator
VAWGVLDAAAAMHAIAFGMKRAFHGFLRVTRKPLGAVGLTAARFDMMCAIEEPTAYVEDVFPISQKELRKALGVSASVVSRMVRALEALGWVMRERMEGDRRQWWIELTEAGRALIRQVRRWLVRGMHRVVLHAICFGEHRDADAQFRNMDRLEGYLRVLRRECADRATLYYPWGHPDD